MNDKFYQKTTAALRQKRRKINETEEPMYAAHPRMRGEGNVQKDKQQTKKKVRKIATHSQSKFRTALNSE